VKFRKHGEITAVQEPEDDTEEVPKHVGDFVSVSFKY
jgi:hypothetical protein